MISGLDGGAALAPVPAGSDPGDSDTLFPTVRSADQRQHGAPASAPVGGDVVASSLDQAASVTESGGTAPDLEYRSLPRRLLARATGTVLAWLLRLIAVDQQHFNRLVLAALRGLASERDDLRQRLDALIADLHPQLERAYSERRALEADLSTLRRAIRELEAETREHATVLADIRIAEFRLARRTGEATASPAKHGTNDTDSATSASRRLEAPEIDRRLVADAFRGSEADITERQRRYVGYFQGADPVLDIGCGRGEFLQLLAQAGIPAYGVELDDDLALWCREKGLDVRRGDALDYLAGIDDGQLGGIFCAQVIEHLLTDDLLRLVDLAHRKLKPGAPLVIETLNPESLLVLYRWFWVDLTHERLVHPETLKFVLRACGFQDVTLEFVPAPDGPRRIPPLQFTGQAPTGIDEFNGATQYLNDLLYASFDYAVVAVR